MKKNNKSRPVQVNLKDRRGMGYKNLIWLPNQNDDLGGLEEGFSRSHRESMENRIQVTTTKIGDGNTIAIGRGEGNAWFARIPCSKRDGMRT